MSNFVSDETLMAAYAEASGVAHDTVTHLAGLRAVVALTQEDQAKRDAAIAKGVKGKYYPQSNGWVASEQVEDAILGQSFTGKESEENE